VGYTGTSSNYQNSNGCHFGGNVYSNQQSDIRLKTDITRIPNALDIIEQLRPVEFDWKYDEYD
jgi:hypothetical protein